MIVVITGGSKGIGLNVAKAFVEKGHKVFSFSRSSPPDKSINYIYCDVSDEISVAEAFNEFYLKEDRIDLLVNNAGIGLHGAIENAKSTEIKKIFNVNLNGAVYACQHVISKMRNQKSGKIVFVSSVAGVFALPFQTFYSASKMSINALSDGLRMELKPFNIKVGCLLVGDTNTGFTKNFRKNLQNEERYVKRIERSLDIMERDEKNGTSAEKMGRQIAKYLHKNNLKPTKVFGKFFYKIVCFLQKIMPKRFVLWLVYKIYAK